MASKKWTKEKKDAKKLVFMQISDSFGLELKQIQGFPCFAVSTDGSVWNVDPDFKKILSERELEPFLGKSGYYGVWINQTNKKPKYKLIHKLVASTFLGERPTKQHLVRHKDGNCLNNKLENLLWGTTQENADDRKLHNESRTKLTPELREELIKRLETDNYTSIEDLSKEYKLSVFTVNKLYWALKD